MDFTSGTCAKNLTNHHRCICDNHRVPLDMPGCLDMIPFYLYREEQEEIPALLSWSCCYMLDHLYERLIGMLDHFHLKDTESQISSAARRIRFCWF